MLILKLSADKNIVWHHATVTRARRETQNGHRGAIVWFTGLSGSGKSTLAHAVEEALHQRGCRTFVLDGDNVRHGLNRDLGFSAEHRSENIRRIAEVAKLMNEAGLIVITAFISPYRADREMARQIIGGDKFIEVHVATPIATCEQRDVKGLYQRARAGEIAQFTGISAPYEAPVKPAASIDTGVMSLDDALAKLMQLLQHNAPPLASL